MPPLTQPQPGTTEKPRKSLEELYAETNKPSTATPTAPAKTGGVGGFFKGIVQNTLNLGQTVAASQLKDDPHFQNYERSQRELQATRDQVFKRVKQKQARGEDASQLIQMLKDTAMSDSRDVYGDLSASLDKTNLQVGAEFAGLALDIASFGSLPGVVKGAVTGQMFKAGAQQAGKAVAQQAPSILRGAAQGAWTGLKYGTGFGAAYGAQRAVAGGETDVGQIATEAGTGAATGAVVGGALGGVLGGAGGAWQAHKMKVIQKAEATMASPEGWKYNRTPKGAVDDFATTEALRQGFDDVDVKFVKQSTPGDQAAYRKIYQTSEKIAADKFYGIRHNRMEIPGAKANERMQFISNQRKVAGAQVGEAVKNMPNQAADITDDVYRPFMDDLTEAGVGVIKNADDLAASGSKNLRIGDLDFSRSRFAWDKSTQSLIQRTYDDIAPNAQGVAARTPRQVYTTRGKLWDALDKGTKTNTLVKNSKRILNDVYESLEKPLINASDEYVTVAHKYAQTSGMIREYNALMGKDFQLSDEVANLRAGEVARRMTGHASARVIKVMDKLDDLAKELGYKSDESIANQVVFAADILEQPGVFKTAPGSLRGQAGRGVVDAAEAGLDVARGRYGSLLERGVQKGYEKFADINPEAKKKALRMLIGLEKAPAAKPGMISRLGSKLSSPVKVEPSAGMSVKYVGDKATTPLATMVNQRKGEGLLADTTEQIIRKGFTPVQKYTSATANRTYNDILHSESGLERAVAVGDLPAKKMYTDVAKKILTPEHAKARINDIAQKLDLYKEIPGLGNKFRNAVKPTGNTLESLISKGHQILDTAIKKSGRALGIGLVGAGAAIKGLVTPKQAEAATLLPNGNYLVSQQELDDAYQNVPPAQQQQATALRNQILTQRQGNGYYVTPQQQQQIQAIGEASRQAAVAQFPTTQQIYDQSQAQQQAFLDDVEQRNTRAAEQYGTSPGYRIMKDLLGIGGVLGSAVAVAGTPVNPYSYGFITESLTGGEAGLYTQGMRVMQARTAAAQAAGQPYWTQAGATGNAQLAQQGNYEALLAFFPEAGAAELGPLSMQEEVLNRTAIRPAIQYSRVQGGEMHAPSPMLMDLAMAQYFFRTGDPVHGMVFAIAASEASPQFYPLSHFKDHASWDPYRKGLLPKDSAIINQILKTVVEAGGTNFLPGGQSSPQPSPQQVPPAMAASQQRAQTP